MSTILPQDTTARFLGPQTPGGSLTGEGGGRVRGTGGGRDLGRRHVVGGSKSGSPALRPGAQELWAHPRVSTGNPLSLPRTRKMVARRLTSPLRALCSAAHARAPAAAPHPSARTAVIRL